MNRNLVASIGLVFALIVFTRCSFQKDAEPVKMTGFIQGTTFSVIWYPDQPASAVQKGIDSIFLLVNQTASLYDSSSIISRFNRNEPCEQNIHFQQLVTQSQRISEQTQGAFDITVAPLIRLWGFYRKEGTMVSDSLISEWLMNIGYSRLQIAPDGLVVKLNPGVEIDLNGIAQGYTVDLIAGYFDSLGIDRYLVEVGGEVRCGNKKSAEEPWIIGIEKPAPSDTAPQVVQVKIAVENRSVATSGNYRNYFRENGHTYSHTIDPRTGIPMKDGLISVTVLSTNCTEADAYATALMVMGLEPGLLFIEEHPGLEAFFIASEGGKIVTRQSSGFPPFLDTL
ncbi:MAG: FAD:protein FMN transferase [Bacteroidales bacterium]|nr:FAD:protein FMN transferase [Bacteroidales bacterium]